MSWVDDHAFGIIVALIICSLIFIIIGHEYRDQVQTALKRDFVKLPSTTVDYWSVSHFLLFAVFGFIKPGYAFTFLVAGAGFEVVEDYLSSDSTTQLDNCSNKPYNNDGTRKTFCNGINTDYWYGKWDDVFWDITGYVTGQAIRTTFW